ncbi:MAG: ABC transporter permease [Lentimicrobium sp.]|nr:ABC transporter permease [Lentimicrobium sp.]
MFVINIKIALRSLIRQKFYSLINLAGLSAGIAAFLLIAMYVQHELSFDRHLSKLDRLYRVVEIQNEPGVGEQHVAITMGPLAKAMKDDFPQVINAVRFMPVFNVSLIKYNDKSFNEQYLFYADPSAIEMFDIEIVHGNPAQVLAEPRTVLVSEKSALKYFGSAEAAIGKTLLFDNTSFRVSGVMKDQPETSHLYFEMLVPVATAEVLPEFERMKGWGSNSLITYVQLDDPSSFDIINQGFDDFLEKHVFSQKDTWQYLEMYLQPVSKVYLKSGHIKFQNVYAMGDANMVNIFVVISGLILLIACVNYINIAIARSFKRSREVGMRKVLGAGRYGLMVQFISESAIITLAALIMSLGLVELVLPELNSLLGTNFRIDFLSNPLYNLGLVILFIIISLISGYYPAFYLLHLQPIQALKGISSDSGRGTGTLSSVLVVFQFVISIGLILAVLVIRDQVNFIKNKDLGIHYQDILYVGFGDKGYEKLKVVKTELLKNPNIKSVAGCSFMNGVSGSQGPVFVDDTSNTKLYVRYGFVDEDFFETMGIEIAEGRYFDGDLPSDVNRVNIINQAAAKALGWEVAEGKFFMYPEAADSSGKTEVVGVVKDYNYYSLRSQIEPAIWGWQPERFEGVVIKTASKANAEKIKHFIEEKWNDIFPGQPVQIIDAVNYNLKNYRKDQNSFTLFVYFTLISLLLSCLGLFGLTSLILEQKTKSIGIRKVLGGEVWQITFMLIRNYLILVLLAGVIALPIGYYLMQFQLNKFAYRININAFHLLLPILIAILISFTTIVFKAYKSANSNPADVLKYE